MSKKIIPPLQVMVGFAKETDGDLIAQAIAGHDGVKAHPELFSNPPAFETSVAAAQDGGKKATAEKKKARAALIKLVRPLGHYVETNCKDDPTILAASGFKAASKVKVSQQQAEQGLILGLGTGTQSGQIVVKGKKGANARTCVLRFAALGADGKPGNWTDIGVTNPRRIPVNGLTPGTTYAFQLRALGRLGYGDWSEIATRIAI